MSANSIAVITGASGGLGREFVKLLSGDDSVVEIWAIARDQSKLDSLKQEFSGKIRSFSLDLSKTDQLMEFAEVLEKEKPNIAYLINCAGYAKFCSCMDLSIQQSLNMIELNINGVVAMGLACIPYMNRGSHIINVSSLSAFQPLPYLNIYASTKAFIRNYSRALNVELKERGVTVTAVCPGWMATDLLGVASIGAKKTVNKFIGMESPEDVAAKAIKDAKKGRDISVYGFLVKLTHFVSKLLPQRLMMKLWLLQQGW